MYHSIEHIGYNLYTQKPKKVFVVWKLSVHLPRSSVCWTQAKISKKVSTKLLRSAVVRTLFFLLRKLSVDLLRSSVLCQKFEGVRKLSIHLRRSSVCCPGSENCPSNCWGLQFVKHANFAYSENCPYNCQGRQFCVKNWKKCWLLRKLSIHLPPSAVWGIVRTPAKVSSFIHSFYCGSNCQGRQVYGQFLKLP